MSSKLARLKNSIEELERALASRWAGAAGPRTAPVPSSWDDFLAKNDLVAWREKDPLIRDSLLTELLSYPMTLAHFASRMHGLKTVHVVGARAEATLPIQYWAQALRHLPQDSLQLRFVGLDVPAKLNKTEDVATFGEKTMKRSFATEAYRVPSEKPDLFVLFNPGIAHEKLRKSWWPTIQSIMSTQRPVLITGLHLFDAQSDYDLVKTFPQRNVSKPMLNPFASNKDFADGLSDRIARANMYMWSVDA